MRGTADRRVAPRVRGAVFDAMLVALSGRIYLDDTAEATPEDVLRQIWQGYFALDAAAADPG